VTPLVSVIMPTNNRHIFARQAIKYFKRYTNIPAEMIIVDNGTRPLSQKDVSGHPNISHVIVPQQMTIGEMLNTGIRLSKGKIIARQDDDDWCSTDRLEYLFKALNTSRSGIIGTSNCFYYAMFARSAWKFTSWGGSFAFYKDIWEKTPFPDLSMKEDLEFLKAAEKISGEECTHILDNLGLYIHIRHYHNISNTSYPKIGDIDALTKVKEIIGSDLAWYDSFAEMQMKLPYNGDRHGV
jgi:glycosyltransferase involved in cell wall biosynthesis